MDRVSRSTALVLVLALCGCANGSSPASPDPPSGNASYSNLPGEWTSAARTMTIDDRSVAVEEAGEVRFFTYAVKSFNGYGYDLLMSDGDDWFAVPAGDLLSIQTGRYAGTYTFVHR